MAFKSSIYLPQSFSLKNTIGGIGFNATTNEASVDVYDPNNGTNVSTPDSFGPNNGTAKDLTLDEMVAAGHFKLGWVTSRRIIEGELIEEQTFYGEDAVAQQRKHAEKRELQERARNPWIVAPMPNKLMCNYVNKGRNQMTAWMIQDENAVGLSLVQAFGPDPRGLNWQRSDTKASGLSNAARAWTPTDYTASDEVGISLQPLRRALQSLRVGDQQVVNAATPWRLQRQVNLQPRPHGPNIGVRWTQDRAYASGDNAATHHDPTNGYYSSLYNIIDGVIIIQAAWGPAYMEMLRLHTNTPPADDQLPLLKQWSDVTWTMWKQFRQAIIYPAGTWDNSIPGRAKGPTNIQLQTMTSWLNRIVVSIVQSPQEKLETISVCIASRGYKHGNIPTWDDRQTFAIGHWCYYALIACKNNYGLAWLWIQHKGSTNLGHKVFKSVTILWGDDEANADPLHTSWPTLVWQVADMTADGNRILTAKAAVERGWMTLAEGPNPIMDYEFLNVQVGGRIGDYPA
ncbi:hypothetical protein LTR36_002348 [Oleoguttula mirabilis]|uniref:Uncharacterized protein n=1 Tax=Oleoguttula mirabilis TaxID=1507867 RepID=A0AAV9JMP1_9PEZI|nr:hypothetical protein LTR36_002348 [Oleoguttula mirabilis]